MNHVPTASDDQQLLMAVYTFHLPRVYHWYELFISVASTPFESSVLLWIRNVGVDILKPRQRAFVWRPLIDGGSVTWPVFGPPRLVELKRGTSSYVDERATSRSYHVWIGVRWPAPGPRTEGCTRASSSRSSRALISGDSVGRGRGEAGAVRQKRTRNSRASEAGAVREANDMMLAVIYAPLPVVPRARNRTCRRRRRRRPFVADRPSAFFTLWRASAKPGRSSGHY